MFQRRGPDGPCGFPGYDDLIQVGFDADQQLRCTRKQSRADPRWVPLGGDSGVSIQSQRLHTGNNRGLQGQGHLGPEESLSAGGAAAPSDSWALGVVTFDTSQEPCLSAA